jgi:hypothetical protein
MRLNRGFGVHAAIEQNRSAPCRLNIILIIIVSLPVAGCIIEPPAFCLSPVCGSEESNIGPPPGHLENQARVRGMPKIPAQPLIAENGNVWPSQPIKLQTPLDLQKTAPNIDPADYAAHLQQMRHRQGGYGLCRGETPIGTRLGLCAGRK